MLQGSDEPRWIETLHQLMHLLKRYDAESAYDVFVRKPSGLLIDRSSHDSLWGCISADVFELFCLDASLRTAISRASTAPRLFCPASDDDGDQVQ